MRMKLKRIIDQNEAFKGWGHYCPACVDWHVYAVEQPFANGATWTFDGNMEKPTFHPSMKITTGFSKEETRICHYFLRNGILDYCNDSTHSFAGKKVDLPNFPEGFFG